jgi:ATP-dependent Lhr-like helicase
VSSFDRLHPTLQFHIVNSLGWPELRPLQERSIPPIIAGKHVLLIAPTAGGKTEAAVLPVFSRMLEENWRGMSALYVCPLRALLNDLVLRLETLGRLLGRRVAVWHGDIGETQRRRIREEPPDLLLTTPESLEAMLLSTRVDERRLFADVRSLVVDEAHAFAGDDRGWHLLSVAARVERLAQRELQRIALSATIGNGEQVLEWLAGRGSADKEVVEVEVADPRATEVLIDHVGSIANAAVVISGLHRGEKRLVFCDSRSKTEELATALRTHGTRTFVSHSSLSPVERRRTEREFRDSSDCVVVATSTLELGIDIGDLDRVIQIDAPTTVASFLQRLGRTGRRRDTERNCLFLATSEEALLRASALTRLWQEGWVEFVDPPPLPLHIFAQQVLALCLQEGAYPAHEWRKWIGDVPAFTGLTDSLTDEIIGYMASERFLHFDSGLVSVGGGAEREFGARNFMELTSVFTSDPLLSVRHGSYEIGHVHPVALSSRGAEAEVVLTLAARSWRVRHIDWIRHLVFVEPAEVGGRTRWLGDSRPLSFKVARAMRDVLVDGESRVRLTRRGNQVLDQMRSQFEWLDRGRTSCVRESDGRRTWWTFAGTLANARLGGVLGELAAGRSTAFGIPLVASAQGADLEAAKAGLVSDEESSVDVRLVDQLKFGRCLPANLAANVVRARSTDLEGEQACAHEPVTQLVLSEMSDDSAENDRIG